MNNGRLSSRMTTRLTSSRLPSRMSTRITDTRPFTHNSSREPLFARAKLRNKFLAWLKFDRVAGFFELVAILFFVTGFCTEYWATGDNVHAGLFKACRGDLCYDTHVFYHTKIGKLLMLYFVTLIFAEHDTVRKIVKDIDHTPGYILPMVIGYGKIVKALTTHLDTILPMVIG
ncbi:hypothetical protein KUTeg_000262 [Tegillarca granosa]|uniref:Ion transport domain-containing protein n=1 Tax=Tegillarca granosa TaxID=220873 RepID=A0ABQ9G050_TEGGR|nr:hypothetical protein KUTeg_000262 [Tegillarca granosa]